MPRRGERSESKIANGLVGFIGNKDGDKFPGAVKASELDGILFIGFDVIAGFLVGMRDGAMTVQGDLSSDHFAVEADFTFRARDRWRLRHRAPGRSADVPSRSPTDGPRRGACAGRRQGSYRACPLRTWPARARRRGSRAARGVRGLGATGALVRIALVADRRLRQLHQEGAEARRTGRARRRSAKHWSCRATRSSRAPMGTRSTPQRGSRRTIVTRWSG